MGKCPDGKVSRAGVFLVTHNEQSYILYDGLQHPRAHSADANQIVDIRALANFSVIVGRQVGRDRTHEDGTTYPVVSFFAGQCKSWEHSTLDTAIHECHEETAGKIALKRKHLLPTMNSRSLGYTYSTGDPQSTHWKQLRLFIQLFFLVPIF